MEKVIYEGRMSLKSQYGPLVVGAFLNLSGLVSMVENPGLGITVVLISSLVFVGLPYLRVLASAYRVTTERVTQHAGLIARNMSEVEVGDIRNVQIMQGAIERLLGVGSVGVSTSGQSGFEITFSGVINPEAVADLVRDARKDSERRSPNEEPENPQPNEYVIP